MNLHRRLRDLLSPFQFLTGKSGEIRSSDCLRWLVWLEAQLPLIRPTLQRSLTCELATVALLVFANCFEHYILNYRK